MKEDTEKKAFESVVQALGVLEQAFIPSPAQGLNSARAEVLTARRELMQALSK